MPTLMLLRHAKSSWAEAGLRDFDRPLAPRGKRAAPLMGRFLADHGIVPELILCSSTARARETLDLVLDELGGAPEVEFSETLYLASPREMLAELRALKADTQTVMLIGHNPGFHALALTLSNDGDEEDLTAMAQKFPTAALAVIEFDGSWRDLAANTGTLRHFETPRGLATRAHP